MASGSEHTITRAVLETGPRILDKRSDTTDMTSLVYQLSLVGEASCWVLNMQRPYACAVARRDARPRAPARQSLLSSTREFAHMPSSTGTSGSSDFVSRFDGGVHGHQTIVLQVSYNITVYNSGSSSIADTGRRNSAVPPVVVKQRFCCWFMQGAGYVHGVWLAVAHSRYIF